MILNYINYNTLIADTLKLCKRLPRKYDIVVGIPNSGMIPAHVIGFTLGVPVYNINEFRLHVKNVLLVDDSITSGNTMNGAKGFLQDENIDTAVIYTDRPDMDVTYFQKQIDAPRVFQWNIFKHGHLENACLDIDGVLSKDPDFVEDDNKPDQMREFILNTEPLHIPKRTVKAFITNRIEKYRPETEQWLKKHNIKYKHLIMAPFDTANERRKYFTQLGGNGFWKAQKYKEILGAWFIESNITQAKQIKSIIKDSVYCTDHIIML
jgi:hypoxanthine phosphoribosyltransferase